MQKELCSCWNRVLGRFGFTSPYGNVSTSEEDGAGAAGRRAFADIDHIVRIVLIGESRVGKTCILRRYLNDYFDEEGEGEHSATLGVDFGCKTVDLQGQRVRLQVWDTGGVDSFATVVSHYLHGADGIALVYDVNNKSSFERLRRRWAPFVAEHAPGTAKVVLMGNKAEVQPFFRQVATSEAQRLADALNVPAFEVSALDGTNIELALLTLTREVLTRPPPPPPEAPANASDGANADASKTAGFSSSMDLLTAGQVWGLSKAAWRRVIVAWVDVFGNGDSDRIREGSRSAACDSGNARDGDESVQARARRGGSVAAAAAGAAAAILGRRPQNSQFLQCEAKGLKKIGVHEGGDSGGEEEDDASSSGDEWWRRLHELEDEANAAPMGGGDVNSAGEEAGVEQQREDRDDSSAWSSEDFVVKRGSTALFAAADGAASGLNGGLSAADDAVRRQSSTARVAARWLSETRAVRASVAGSSGGRGYGLTHAGANDLLGLVRKRVDASSDSDEAVPVPAAAQLGGMVSPNRSPKWNQQQQQQQGFELEAELQLLQGNQDSQVLLPPSPKSPPPRSKRREDFVRVAPTSPMA